MRAIYLFPALLGACFALFGSSGSLQAQDGATPPDSASAPIDPSDGQPPQGPNNPPQPPANPPPEICGIEAKDPFECKRPYDIRLPYQPPYILGNQKCKIRGKCVRNEIDGKRYCEDIEDLFLLDEYEGTTTIEKIKQIDPAPDAPKKQLYDKIEKICYEVYECETECVKQGTYQCKRKRDPKDKKTYFEYKFKGDCPPKQGNENPNPNPEPPKPEIGPDLN
jgi:hypothetical protein